MRNNDGNSLEAPFRVDAGMRATIGGGQRNIICVLDAKDYCVVDDVPTEQQAQAIVDALNGSTYD